MKLSKSFAALDAMADELLSKSMKKSEDVPEEENIKPEDISENVPEDEVEESPETAEEPESKEESEKESDEVKKSIPEEEEEVIEKSEDVMEDEPVDEEPEEDIEKCGTIKKSEEAEEESEDEEVREELEDTIRRDVEGHEEIKKSIDASEFLAAMTEVLVKSMTDQQYKRFLTEEQSSVSNEVLAKSLQASLQLNKSMQEEIQDLRAQNDSLVKSMNDGFTSMREFISSQFEELSHQPATMRKSVGNISVHDRDFHKSLTGRQSGVETLSKAEVLGVLNNLMYSGNPLVTASDIISYESGAPLRPEVAQLVSSKM